MESYILRIYRRKGRKSRLLVGTVEEVGETAKRSFSNYAELWEILEPRRKPRAAPKEEASSSEAG